MDPARGSTLAQLIAADGMDTGFGSVGEEAWRSYVRETAARIGIAPGSSVFEVGCGAGAYLFDLYEQGCDVAGLDASRALIGYARQAMPGSRWTSAEAAELDASEKFDVVMASAVFLYFPSLDYATTVLEKMARKARRAVMVLDVPDAATRDAALAFRRRIAGDEAYARKYEGLDHLYFDRAWFEKSLTAFGMRRIEVENQRIEGYANSAYRFNVFAWRG